MLSALVRREKEEEEESDSGLKAKMEREFKEKGDLVKFMTGIGTSLNKETGRVESHYPKSRAKTRKKRTVKPRKIKFPLSETALCVFNQLNNEAQEKERRREEA